MTTFYYGLESRQQVFKLARKVCNALGKKNDLAAELMILETPCAETQLGTYPDSSPDSHGVGLCQHDEIGLLDIQQEGEQRHFNIIKHQFGYDILSLELKDLANDPLLSLICCRLSYKRIPEPIPDTLEERAQYWKTHYNTYHPNAKGTVEHYIASAKRFLHCEGV